MTTPQPNAKIVGEATPPIHDGMGSSFVAKGTNAARRSEIPDGVEISMVATPNLLVLPVITWSART